jgi:hypothetical protein
LQNQKTATEAAMLQFMMTVMALAALGAMVAAAQADHQGEHRYGTEISASGFPEVEYRPPVTSWMAGSATGVHVRSGRTRAKLQRLRLDLGFVAVALRRIEACTNQKTDREAAMRQSTMTVMALAAFGTMVMTAQAENQTQSSNRFTSSQEADRVAGDVSRRASMKGCRPPLSTTLYTASKLFVNPLENNA